MIVLPLDSSLRRGFSAIAFRQHADEATVDIIPFHACIQAIQKNLMAGTTLPDTLAAQRWDRRLELENG
jgi:hypothetical protein